MPYISDDVTGETAWVEPDVSSPFYNPPPESTKEETAPSTPTVIPLASGPSQAAWEEAAAEQGITGSENVAAFKEVEQARYMEEYAPSTPTVIPLSAGPEIDTSISPITGRPKIPGGDIVVGDGITRQQLADTGFAPDTGMIGVGLYQSQKEIEALPGGKDNPDFRELVKQGYTGKQAYDAITSEVDLKFTLPDGRTTVPWIEYREIARGLDQLPSIVVEGKQVYDLDIIANDTGLLSIYNKYVDPSFMAAIPSAAEIKYQADLVQYEKDLAKYNEQQTILSTLRAIPGVYTSEEKLSLGVYGPPRAEVYDLSRAIKMGYGKDVITAVNAGLFEMSVVKSIIERHAAEAQLESYKATSSELVKLNFSQQLANSIADFTGQKRPHSSISYMATTHGYDLPAIVAAGKEAAALKAGIAPELLDEAKRYTTKTTEPISHTHWEDYYFKEHKWEGSSDKPPQDVIMGVPGEATRAKADLWVEHVREAVSEYKKAFPNVIEEPVRKGYLLETPPTKGAFTHEFSVLSEAPGRLLAATPIGMVPVVGSLAMIATPLAKGAGPEGWKGVSGMEWITGVVGAIGLKAQAGGLTKSFSAEQAEKIAAEAARVAEASRLKLPVYKEGLPIPKPEMTRLYRGEPKTQNLKTDKLTGQWFSTKRYWAEPFAGKGGKLFYLDVPTEKLADFQINPRAVPGSIEFIVPFGEQVSAMKGMGFPGTTPWQSVDWLGRPVVSAQTPVSPWRELLKRYNIYPEDVNLFTEKGPAVYSYGKGPIGAGELESYLPFASTEAPPYIETRGWRIEYTHQPTVVSSFGRDLWKPEPTETLFGPRVGPTQPGDISGGRWDITYGRTPGIEDVLWSPYSPLGGGTYGEAVNVLAPVQAATGIGALPTFGIETPTGYTFTLGPSYAISPQGLYYPTVAPSIGAPAIAPFPAPEKTKIRPSPAFIPGPSYTPYPVPVVPERPEKKSEPGIAIPIPSPITYPITIPKIAKEQEPSIVVSPAVVKVVEPEIYQKPEPAPVPEPSPVRAPISPTAPSIVPVIPVPPIPPIPPIPPPPPPPKKKVPIPPFIPSLGPIGPQGGISRGGIRPKGALATMLGAQPGTVQVTPGYVTGKQMEKMWKQLAFGAIEEREPLIVKERKVISGVQKYRTPASQAMIKAVGRVQARKPQLRRPNTGSDATSVQKQLGITM